MSIDTARVLEFPRVLDMLSRRCQYSVAVDRAHDLGPSGDTDQVRYLLAVTREAVELLNGNPGFTVGGVRDIRDIVERARVGVLLAPGDLRDTLDTIQASAALRRTFFKLAQLSAFVFWRSSSSRLRLFPVLRPICPEPSALAARFSIALQQPWEIYAVTCASLIDVCSIVSTA